jgi:hypothetical protein
MNPWRCDRAIFMRARPANDSSCTSESQQHKAPFDLRRATRLASVPVLRERRELRAAGPKCDPQHFAPVRTRTSRGDPRRYIFCTCWWWRSLQSRDPCQLRYRAACIALAMPDAHARNHTVATTRPRLDRARSSSINRSASRRRRQLASNRRICSMQNMRCRKAQFLRSAQLVAMQARARSRRGCVVATREAARMLPRERHEVSALVLRPAGVRGW